MPAIQPFEDRLAAHQEPVPFDPGTDLVKPVLWQLPLETVSMPGDMREEPAVELNGTFAPLMPLLGHIRDALAERPIEPLDLTFSMRHTAAWEENGRMQVDLRLPNRINGLERISGPGGLQERAGQILREIEAGNLSTLDGLTDSFGFNGIDSTSPEATYLISWFKAKEIERLRSAIISGEISDSTDKRFDQEVTEGKLEEVDVARLRLLVAERELKLDEIRITLESLLSEGKVGFFPKTFQELTDVSMGFDHKLDDVLRQRGRIELLEVARSLFWEAVGMYDEYQVAKSSSDAEPWNPTLTVYHKGFELIRARENYEGMIEFMLSSYFTDYGLFGIREQKFSGVEMDIASTGPHEQYDIRHIVDSYSVYDAVKQHRTHKRLLAFTTDLGGSITGVARDPNFKFGKNDRVRIQEQQPRY